MSGAGSGPGVGGLHHVTAVTADAQANLDFYAGVLGLRFVKQTVNQDDPFTYHLYYGDELGRPGTAMTFFPFQGVPPGRPGRGQVLRTAFAVPREAIPAWRERLAAHGVESREQARFGVPALALHDGDGLPLELVGDAAPDTRPGWPDGPVAAAEAIRSFAGVELASGDPAATAHVLTELLGYAETATEDGRTRFVVPGEGPASWVDLLDRAAPGHPGAGTVHHVAFRVPDTATQVAVQDALLRAGLRPTAVIDRFYFRSVYCLEPGGILFEIATDGPGFTVDEPAESLGSSLQLTAAHEPLRARIEAALPPLRRPG